MPNLTKRARIVLDGYEEDGSIEDIMSYHFSEMCEADAYVHAYEAARNMGVADGAVEYFIVADDRLEREYTAVFLVTRFCEEHGAVNEEDYLGNRNYVTL